MLRRVLLTLAAGMAGGASLVMSAAQQPARPAAGVAIDADDIGGTVTSARGPEAGVWVIAETTDTPTKLRKIVVTDDRGVTSCRTCRPRPTSASGSAGTAWWIGARVGCDAARSTPRLLPGIARTGAESTRP